MSDERTIYISPEDDLTTVRERLEQLQSKRVTLVIPVQTQLRSHVAWKLLYARTRELGKEVLIVSSDPQVRSVAHAVKFKVAHSLESSATGKTRPTSRPVRSGSSNKSKPSSGATPPSALGKAFPSASGETDLPPQQADFVESREDLSENSSEAGYEPASSPFHTERDFNQSYDFNIDTSPPIRPLPVENIEDPDLLLEDYTRAQGIRHAADNSRQRRRLPAKAIDPNEIDREEKPVARADTSLPAHKAINQPIISEDPFDYMEDDLPPPASEQRGSVSITRHDTNEHVIEDVADPSDNEFQHKIEYGNDGGLAQSSGAQANAFNPQVEPIAEEEVDERGPSPRYIQGVRSRRGRQPSSAARQQNNPSPSRVSPRSRDLQQQNNPPPSRVSPRSRDLQQQQNNPSPSRVSPRSRDLQQQQNNPPPAAEIEERPTRVRPSAAGSPAPIPLGRPSVPLGQRGSKPLQRFDSPVAGTKQSSQVLGRSAPPGNASQRGISADLTSIPAPRPSTRTRPGDRRNRRNNRSGILIISIIAIILIAIIGSTLYFLPVTKVTITVTARDYSHPLALVASAKDQSNAVTALTINKDFSQNGNVAATGSTQEDKGAAKGYVCISNNSDQSVDVPSSTIISTSNNNAQFQNIQFTTQADTLIQSHYVCSSSNDPNQIPVQAVKAGESGNVPAGQVTVITDSGLSNIVKNNTNLTAAGLKLTVTNDTAMAGGGAQKVPAVTAQDLVNARTTLHKQLQSNIDAWLKQLATTGVVGQPGNNDTLINPPAAGTVEENGNFPAILTVHETVLFLSNNNLQKAAFTQLNNAIRDEKNFSNYTIVTSSEAPITIAQMQPVTGDTSSMTIKFNATGKAVPFIARDQIQRLVAGQSVLDARTKVAAYTPGIQNVAINTNPTFFSGVAYWPAHINVVVQPALNTIQPNK